MSIILWTYRYLGSFFPSRKRFLYDTLAIVKFCANKYKYSTEPASLPYLGRNELTHLIDVDIACTPNIEVAASRASTLRPAKYRTPELPEQIEPLSSASPVMPVLPVPIAPVLPVQPAHYQTPYSPLEIEPLSSVRAFKGNSNSNSNGNSIGNDSVLITLGRHSGKVRQSSKCTKDIHYMQLARKEVAVDMQEIADHYLTARNHPQPNAKELIIWENHSAARSSFINLIHPYDFPSTCNLCGCLKAEVAEQHHLAWILGTVCGV